MILDEKGHKALHEREGLELRPYLDIKGVPTIALGNTYYLDGRKVTMQDKPLTLQQAKELGAITANRFAADVNKAVKSKINQNQFNALVSIAYNIGITGFKNSTFLRLVNKDPNDHNIASAIMMWVKDIELLGRRCDEIMQYYGKRNY